MWSMTVHKLRKRIKIQKRNKTIRGWELNCQKNTPHKAHAAPLFCLLFMLMDDDAQQSLHRMKINELWGLIPQSINIMHPSNADPVAQCLPIMKPMHSKTLRISEYVKQFNFGPSGFG